MLYLRLHMCCTCSVFISRKLVLSDSCIPGTVLFSLSQHEEGSKGSRSPQEGDEGNEGKEGINVIGRIGIIELFQFLTACTKTHLQSDGPVPGYQVL